MNLLPLAPVVTTLNWTFNPSQISKIEEGKAIAWAGHELAELALFAICPLCNDANTLTGFVLLMSALDLPGSMGEHDDVFATVEAAQIEAERIAQWDAENKVGL